MPSSWKICFAASLDASSPNRTTGKVTEEPSGPAGVISPTRNQQGARMSSGCAPALHHKVSSIGRNARSTRPTRLFRLLERFYQFRHYLEQVADNPIIGNFEYRRIRVFINGY